MHLRVQFNHFNRAHWVAVRCEASGASEATPAVAEASGSYLYHISWYVCRLRLVAHERPHASVFWVRDVLALHALYIYM